MGLDMYLRSSKNEEELIYWRKANAINKWFEDHVANGELENLERYPVKKEDLVSLRNLCEYVINSSKLVVKEVAVKTYDYRINSYVERMVIDTVIDDPSIAEELLPTQEGFFYGSTNYNEGYIEDLKYTVDKIDHILKEFNFENDELYYEAWW